MSRILGSIFGKSGIAVTTRTGIFKLDDVFYLQNLSTTTFDYIVVGGGAGGGPPAGGGGGAGGYLTGSVTNVKDRGIYTVVVGAGGAIGSNGQNSDLYPPTVSNPNPEYIRALGGGAGGSPGGAPGGSGGGDSGLGTPGQGNPGGYGGPGPNGISYGGGGGAGASGSLGIRQPGVIGGPGGVGKAAFLGDSSVPPSYGTPGPGPGRWFAGGGAGNAPRFTGPPGPGFGGAGGGGNGATAGTVNTGGGGGWNASGGSGIVIVRYPLEYRAAKTTGTVTRTTSEFYQVYNFTGPGTISF